MTNVEKLKQNLDTLTKDLEQLLFNVVSIDNLSCIEDVDFCPEQSSCIIKDIKRANHDK